MNPDRLSRSTTSAAATVSTSTSLFSPSSSIGPLRSSLKRPAGDAGLDDPTNTRRQLSSLKIQMSSLERTNHQLKTREKEQESQIEQQRMEIERLKTERRVLHQGEMQEREVGQGREQEFYAERRQLNDEITNLRRRNTSITDELERLKSQHNFLTGQHSHLSQNANGEITLLTNRLKEVERERDDLKNWERRAKGLSIELEEEKRRSAEKRMRNDDAVEGKRVDEVLHKEVKRQSLNLSTIYRENESLKLEVAELRQKKKEVDAVERAAKDVERALKDEIRVLQEQLERARRDMDSLTHTFPSTTSSPETSSDSTLRSRLSTMSELHQKATDDIISRDATIRELRERLANLAESSRSSVSVLTKRAEEAERELRWAKEGRASAERREELARQEIERTRAGSQGSSSSGERAVSLGDQSAKVAELESLVAMYKHELDSVSRDSREVEERVAQGMGLVKAADLQLAKERISQLELDITSLENTITELTSANTRLDAEVNDLMRRVASGEYNPATERCLELRANPSAKIMAVRKQELDDLRAENDELLERMRELDELLAEAHSGQQSGGGDGKDAMGMVPRSSFDRLKKDNEEMEKAHAKRLLRLKEIFGTKSKEFLEAVYSLLGWRIKFDESGADIRLTSMYAPKGKMGLTLKFASQEGHFGTMQMSGALARGLEESRHFWIVERQSVPGFLAQITTEMFEKTTIGRAAGYVGLE